MAVMGQGGLAERWALGELHSVARMKAVEVSVDRLDRALVYQMRGHRRIRLNDVDGRVLAESDANGDYVLVSENASVTINKGTLHGTRNNVINIQVAV